MNLSAVDIAVVVVYLAATLALGRWAGAGMRPSLTAYFLGDRRTSGVIAGLSTAASALSIDTPQYVAGLTLAGGIGANWEWWCYLVGGAFGAVFLARLWRRAGVLTDNELIALRYHGPAAALLRTARALAFGVVVNVIGTALVIKGTFVLFEHLWGETPWWIVPLSLASTFLYTGFAGFRGVVLTDALQLVVAVAGSAVVAVYAVGAASPSGDLTGLVDAVRARRPELLTIVPPAGAFATGLHALAFGLFVQWWAFLNADGGGKAIQRMAACRTEGDAVTATVLFNLIQYPLRSFLWVPVGLAAVVLLPDLDPAKAETAYVQVMQAVVPEGLRGLVIAALLAAYMSTVDTQLNWGAGYVVRDVLMPHADPDAEAPRALAVSRVVTAGLLIAGTVVAWHAETMTGLFRLLLSVGAGLGPITLLRWFLPGVNAWVEIAAMAVSMVLSTALAAAGTALHDRILIVLGACAVVCPIVAWATPRDPDTHLAVFYARCRPPGAWGRIATLAGITPPPFPWRALAAWAAAAAGLAGLTVASVAWALFP